MVIDGFCGDPSRLPVESAVSPARLGEGAPPDPPESPCLAAGRSSASQWRLNGG